MVIDVCEVCDGPRSEAGTYHATWCTIVCTLREQVKTLEDRVFELEEACADNGIHKGV